MILMTFFLFGIIFPKPNPYGPLGFIKLIINSEFLLLGANKKLVNIHAFGANNINTGTNTLNCPPDQKDDLHGA